MYFIYTHTNKFLSIIYLGVAYVVSQIYTTADISLSCLHQGVRLNITSPFSTQRMDYRIKYN